MGAPRPLRRAAALLLGLVLLVAGRDAAPDADVARAALEAGRQALDRKDWAAARAQFERALEEDPSLVEARVALGDALAGAKDPEGAAKTLRRALADLEALVPLPKAQVALYTGARKRLLELGRGDAELDALARKHAETLVTIGAKWSPKDVNVADRALRAALRLAPDHARAAALLEKLGTRAPKKGTSLFNGRDTTGWTWMSDPEWRVESSVIHADVSDKAMLARTHQSWSGDFDVLAEVRLVEPFPKNGPPHFCVQAAWTDPEHATGFGLLRGAVFWFDRSGSEEVDQRELFDQPFANVGKGIDPKAWNTYEIRLRGDTMHALVNGVEVAQAPRAKDRTGGHVVLKVQCCIAEFRRVEITSR